MTPVLQLLLELAILIAVAKVAGYLSTRLNQPAVLGEILAGLLLGPSLIDIQSATFLSSPHLEEIITELAEIGVIFLMFLAGLEVDLEQMRKAGRVVIWLVCWAWLCRWCWVRSLRCRLASNRWQPLASVCC